MELSDIINGSVDAYAFLSVSPDASESEVKRSYRKLALQYHPDKDPSEAAKQKFHLLSQIYEILTSSRLKSEYDRLRQLRQGRAEERSKLDAETRRFKEELERAEKEHNFNKRGVYDASANEYIQRESRKRRVEMLREEGLSKRRKREQQRLSEEQRRRDTKIVGDPEGGAAGEQMHTYSTYKDIDADLIPVTLETDTSDVSKGTAELALDSSTSAAVESTGSTSTIVKWKSKPELKGLINEDVLEQIMGIFGPVVGVKLLPTKKQARYDTAEVDFASHEAALKATAHNYKQSAALWDGTKVRKLSSLLRECTLVPSADASTAAVTAPAASTGDSFTTDEISFVSSYIQKSRYPYLKTAWGQILSGTGIVEETLRRVIKKDIGKDQ